MNIPVKLGSSSLLVKISYLVLIRKIGIIKNRLILTGIFIEMSVIEIEYELNKINVFTKIDEEPTLLRNTQLRGREDLKGVFWGS